MSMNVLAKIALQMCVCLYLNMDSLALLVCPLEKNYSLYKNKKLSYNHRRSKKKNVLIERKVSLSDTSPQSRMFVVDLKPLHY